MADEILTMPLWDRLLADTSAGDATWDGYIDAPRPRRTHLAALDSLLGGGIYPGLNVLMASPGAGKTALAIQLLATNAMNGGHSLMFSLEMPVVQVRMRVASMLSMFDADLSCVPWSGTYDYADKSWQRINWELADKTVPHFVAYLEEQCGDNFKNMPLEDVVRHFSGRNRERDETGYMAVEGVMAASGDQTIAAINESDSLVFKEGMVVTQRYHDVDSICAVIREVSQTLDRPPLVAVDYLQIVDPPESARGQGETEATKAMSDELALCARDVGAMILCVSAKRKGSGSEMDAARGSSAITYNAQTVIHLDNDDDRIEQNGWKPVILDVSKNRSGSQGPVALWFNGKYNAFSDAEVPPGVNSEPPFETR